MGKVDIAVWRNAASDDQLHTRIAAKYARASPIEVIRNWIGGNVRNGKVHASTGVRIETAVRSRV